VTSERMSVGLDVHARSVVGAALDGVTGEVLQRRLTPDPAEALAWVRSLPGPVRVTYEAGPTGFRLARVLAAAGVECVVAAPSKLQRPSGDRIKTDQRDALHLAKLLKLGEIVQVRVPSVEQESARDLVRAREDVRGDLMRSRHRLSKLLLRQGIVYSGGRPWTGAHDLWLRRQQLDGVGLRLAFESAYESMLFTVSRRGRLDAAIEAMAASSEFTDVVHRLSCLRGVSVLTGFGLAVEVGDWHRFTGSTIGAYLGLVPTEHSSGSSRRSARSPRPGTPTRADCWSRPHGITARPTGPRAPRCGRGGNWRRRRPGPAATKETDACTNDGRPSPTGRRNPSSRTSPSPGNSPGGAGLWPPWSSAEATQLSGQDAGAVAARGTIRGTPMSSSRRGGHARLLDKRTRSSRTARPAVANPRISV